jgi:hypothetical protein
VLPEVLLELRELGLRKSNLELEYVVLRCGSMLVPPTGWTMDTLFHLLMAALEGYSGTSYIFVVLAYNEIGTDQ